MVYVPSAPSSNSPAWTLETGKAAWNHDLVAEQGGKSLQWGSASSPVIIDDLVLVTGGGTGKGILAYKKDTGALAWAKTDEAYTYATPTVATIKGKLQAICFMNSGLVSVDPQNGAVLWTCPQPKAVAIAASPVVGGKDGDVVYYSTGYNVGAGRVPGQQDGDKWTATELRTLLSRTPRRTSGPRPSIATVTSTACLTTTIINGPLACLEIDTGTVKWSEAGFGSQGGVVLAGDKLLVQTPKGDLVVVPAASDAFKELSRQTILPEKDWTAPTLANGDAQRGEIPSATTGGGTAEIACFKLGN